MKNSSLFAVIVCLGLTGCGDASQSSFDYKTASNESRQAWLGKHAKTLHAATKVMFLSGGSISSKLDLMDPQVNARRGYIKIAMKMKEKTKERYSAKMKRQLERDFLMKVCRGYMSSPIARENVKLLVQVGRKNGGSIVAVSASPQKCKPYADA